MKSCNALEPRALARAASRPDGCSRIARGYRATAYLGLGSNLGDRLAAMRAAVTALNEHARIEADLNAGVASLYETSPVGCSAGEPPYLNSAVRVMTNLIPAELLAAALSIEESLGRVRREKWEQRVIDIDLLLCEDLVLDDTTVTLPHPRLHERLFVLEPLSEIAGDVVHPLLHVTIANLAADRRAQRTGERLLQIAGPDWLRVLRVRGRGIDPLQRVEKGVAQS